MIRPITHRSAILAMMLMLAIVTGCEEGLNPDITPVANLTFHVTNGNTPVEGATIYLFPFKSTYETYLIDNPDGAPQITPPVSSDNVAVTNASGMATFNNFPLEGSSYASGTTFFHNTNPLYFRVEATRPGPVYLTNDNDVFRLSFGELESGTIVNEDVDVVVE